MFKKLLSLSFLLAVFAAGCSQPAPKTAKAGEAKISKTSAKGDGAACCVSKVPSRFTIVKTDDAASSKKAKNN